MSILKRLDELVPGQAGRSSLDLSLRQSASQDDGNGPGDWIGDNGDQDCACRRPGGGTLERLQLSLEKCDLGEHFCRKDEISSKLMRATGKERINGESNKRR